MQDFLSRIPAHDFVPAIAITLSFAMGLAVFLTKQWRCHRRTEMEIALKQDMVNRGMSAEEIERVLKAGNKDK